MAVKSLPGEPSYSFLGRATPAPKRSSSEVKRTGHDDFIVWTASDPAAEKLTDYLWDKGFVILDAPTDQAAVVVVTANKKDLLKAIRDSGINSKHFSISDVGKAKSLGEV